MTQRSGRDPSSPAKITALPETERSKAPTLTIHTNDPDEPRAEITDSLASTPVRDRITR